MKLLLVVALGLLLPCALGSRGLTQTGSGRGGGGAAAAAAAADAPPTPELVVALNRTNYWRAIYQAPPLKWNKTAYAAAADAIKGCAEQPTVPPGFGYNIGYGQQSWTEFIDKMAADKVKYDPKNPRFTPAAGLFTQLVWKSSTALGCAVNTCPKGPLYICLYSPPGNVEGEFLNNVAVNGSSTPTPPAAPAPAPSSGGEAGGPVAGPVAATPTGDDAPPTAELAVSLTRTNYWRGMYNAPALKWSKAAYDAAVNYVKGCPEQIVRTPGYGIIAGVGYGNWQAFVDSSETDKCNYNPSSPVAGRYTQLVWKSTTSLGCAVNSACAKGPNYVCLYSPPGNVVGAYASNVAVPTAAQLSTCPN